MLKTKKFLSVYFLIVFFVMVLMAVYFLKLNKESCNSATIYIEDSTAGEIYSLKNNIKEYFTKTDGWHLCKYIDNELYFLKTVEKNDYIDNIKIMDIYKKEVEEFKTDLNIYDLDAIKSNYIIFSGKGSNNNYKICCLNRQTGEIDTISDRQNNLTEFCCYENYVYYFEQEEKNSLYKFNVLTGKKELVADYICENINSERLNLNVNELGIFFTRCDMDSFPYSWNLYIVNVGEEKTEKFANDVDDILCFYDSKLICQTKDKEENICLIDIDISSGEKRQLWKGIGSYRFNIQINKVVCTDDNGNVEILDLDSGNIKKVTL